jgi:hypothetical protein
VAVLGIFGVNAMANAPATKTYDTYSGGDVLAWATKYTWYALPAL